MKKIKAWIAAARLRTLPLSVSGIVVGTGLAAREQLFDRPIFIWALLTTLGLQILSNFANDYGDGVKGTDNEERIGPARALQSGALSAHQMRLGIIFTAVITLLFAITLIFSAFEKEEMLYVVVFLLLGILSIAAAIKYTVGNTAYGYRGLGDVFVFLFFGLLSVAGSYFLYSKAINLEAVILSAIVGLLSTVVINLNNMRDRESDFKAGKHTLAVKLGKEWAQRYHIFLISGAFLLTSVYLLREPLWKNSFLLLPFIPLGIHLKRVICIQDPKDLDPELKKVALSTFLFAVIYLLSAFV